MLGVPTPTIDAIIEIASTIGQTDYWEIGRTVERLDIDSLSLRDLRLMAIGESQNGVSAKAPPAGGEKDKGR
jgi:opine dehydrogenase